MGQVRLIGQRDESGQAAVEAAVVIPVAFIVLLALTWLAYLAGSTELVSMAIEDTSWNVDVVALYDAQGAGNQGEMDALVEEALCAQPVIAILGGNAVEVSNTTIDVRSGYRTTYSPLRETTAGEFGVSGIQDTRRVVRIGYDVTYTTGVPYAALFGDAAKSTTRHVEKDLTVYRGAVIG